MTDNLRRAFAAVFLFFLTLGGLPDPAAGHTKSTSYSRWHIEETEELRAGVQIRLPLLELTRFPAGHDWHTYLKNNLRLFAGGQPCQATQPIRQVGAPTGWAIFRWDVRCAEKNGLIVRSDILVDVLSSHLHFARVAEPGGSIRERVLVAGSPEWALAPDGEATTPEEAVTTTVPEYVALGVAHILGGWDHLAFVLALLFLAMSLREVGILITAFTLAHSLTLGLAVIGIYRPDPLAIEVLIGFSIALVAIENSWLLGGRQREIPTILVGLLLISALLATAGQGALHGLTWVGLALFSACHFGLLQIHQRPDRLRAAVAFVFGLAHGFGFAGVLMEVDLPLQRMLPALFGFNLGVEIGQLSVVLAIWPLLYLLARFAEGRWYQLLAEGSSAVIAGLGVYWIVLRNWG